MYFQLIRKQVGFQLQWRWRLRAANHEPIANSGEYYVNRADCVHAIELIKGTNALTRVVEVHE